MTIWPNPLHPTGGHLDGLSNPHAPSNRHMIFEIPKQRYNTPGHTTGFYIL